MTARIAYRICTPVTCLRLCLLPIRGTIRYEVYHITHVGPSLSLSLCYEFVCSLVTQQFFTAAIRYYSTYLAMLPLALSPSVRLLRDISCTFNPFTSCPLRQRDMVFFGGGGFVYIYTYIVHTGLFFFCGTHLCKTFVTLTRFRLFLMRWRGWTFL